MQVYTLYNLVQYKGEIRELFFDISCEWEELISESGASEQSTDRTQAQKAWPRGGIPLSKTDKNRPNQWTKLLNEYTFH